MNPIEPDSRDHLVDDAPVVDPFRVAADDARTSAELRKAIKLAHANGRLEMFKEITGYLNPYYPILTQKLPQP